MTDDPLFNHSSIFSYKGARCEIEVQFCKPDSCLNNGTCSVVDNVIQCDCSETGTFFLASSS